MADHKIETELSLKGGNTYKKAIEDSARSLKSMGLELKLNSSEANLNGESLENLKKRQEILAKETEKQKEHIQTLSDGLAAASKAYGENAKETAFYRDGLTKANIALNAMEGDSKATTKAIDNFGKGVKDTEKKTIDWGAALSKIGGGLKTAAVATGAAMAAIGTATVAAGKAIFDMTSDAGKLADELITTSAQTGISTTSLQEWGYAARFIDTEVETITGSMAKMIKQLSTAKDGTGASAEAFAALGVSITGSNGELLNSQDIFFAAIDALGQVANETERDALAMQLFGKSAQDLNPLIKAGSDELARLGAEAQAAGLVLDETALGSLGGFDDTMQRLQATVKGTAQNVAMIFLPALQSVASGAQEVMTTISSSLRDGFQPEDIETIGLAISQKLSDGMNRLTEFLPSVISTVSDVLSKLVSFAVDYLPKLLPQLMDAAVKLLQGAIKAITDNISKISEMVTTLIRSFVKFIVDNLPAVIKVAIEIILALVKGLVAAIPDLVAALPEIISAIVNGLIEAIPQVLSIGADMVKGLWDGIKSMAAWLGDKVGSWIGGVWKDIKSFFGIASPSKLMAETIGKPLVQGIAVGITGNAGLIDAAMNDLMPSAVHSNVSLDVTRRFSDITNSNARSKSSLVEAIREAMGEPVIMLNDREMGRYVRKAAFA